MKNILIISHDGADGTEFIHGILMSGGAFVSVVDESAGDSLPDDVFYYDGIVVIGGAPRQGGNGNGNGKRYASFLFDELRFLKRAVDADIPVMGLSGGARRVAEACGAGASTVNGTKATWENFALTATGRRDMLFYGLPRSMWLPMPGDDVFALPQGATILATSGNDVYQAFRYRNAYGVHYSLSRGNDNGGSTVPESVVNVSLSGGACRPGTDIYKKTRAICLNFLYLADMRAKAFDTECGSEQWLIGQAEVNNWKIA